MEIFKSKDVLTLKDILTRIALLSILARTIHAQSEEECFKLSNSTKCPNYKDVEIHPTSDYKSEKEFDDYFDSLLLTNETGLSNFKNLYGCTGFNAKYMRYSETTLCARLIEPNACKKLDKTICKDVCDESFNTMKDGLNDTNMCPADTDENTKSQRETLTSEYRRICSSATGMGIEVNSPSNCVAILDKEKSHCGFNDGKESKEYCGKNPHAICCAKSATISNLIGDTKDPAKDQPKNEKSKTGIVGPIIGIIATVLAVAFIGVIGKKRWKTSTSENFDANQAGDENILHKKAEILEKFTGMFKRKNKNPMRGSMVLTDHGPPPASRSVPCNEVMYDTNINMRPIEGSGVYQANDPVFEVSPYTPLYTPSPNPEQVESEIYYQQEQERNPHRGIRPPNIDCSRETMYDDDIYFDDDARYVEGTVEGLEGQGYSNEEDFCESENPHFVEDQIDPGYADQVYVEEHQDDSNYRQTELQYGNNYINQEEHSPVNGFYDGPQVNREYTNESEFESPAAYRTDMPPLTTTSDTSNTSSMVGDLNLMMECFEAYEAKLEDELELRIGDIVNIKAVFEDGWGFGRIQNSKRKGTFPVWHLKPFGELRSADFSRSDLKSGRTASLGHPLTL